MSWPSWPTGGGRNALPGLLPGRSWHVHVRTLGGRPGLPVNSEDTHHAAVALALAAYRAAPDGTVVEVTHGGLVAWGPFVKGRTDHVPSECRTEIVNPDPEVK